MQQANNNLNPHGQGSLFSHFYRKNYYLFWVNLEVLIPVAARSKAWVCGGPLAATGGSNPAETMDVCLVIYVCCQVDASASDRSLFQRSTTECGVSECDREPP